VHHDGFSSSFSSFLLLFTRQYVHERPTTRSSVHAYVWASISAIPHPTCHHLTALSTRVL
jgi:hypothetical protein